ncbi:MAG TPA: hypothetical protein VN495_03160 [Candidatus Paceibacterota bacterium]|nr:hypothetical protein [Candidatus Paceibacterota bacterium]
MSDNPAEFGLKLFDQIVSAQGRGDSLVAVDIPPTVTVNFVVEIANSTGLVSGLQPVNFVTKNIPQTSPKFYHGGGTTRATTVILTLKQKPAP